MLIKLFDEVKLMRELEGETIAMIHSTSLMDAIKRLINAYDIIRLNLDINERYPSFDHPTWDNAALNDLKIIYRELAVYHQRDFDPKVMFESYARKMGRLFYTIDMRFAM